MTDIKHLERCFILYVAQKKKNANSNKSEPQTYQNSPNPEDRHQSLARMGVSEFSATAAGIRVCAHSERQQKRFTQSRKSEFIKRDGKPNACGNAENCEQLGTSKVFLT